MNLKIEITQKVLSILNPQYSEKELKKALGSWWVNVRKKDRGGLQLTEAGFQAFELANITPYKIKFFDTPPKIETNQMKLWIDRFMDCPFFITKKEVVVYGNKTAVQLILFSGNVEKFLTAKVHRDSNS